MLIKLQIEVCFYKKKEIEEKKRLSRKMVKRPDKERRNKDNDEFEDTLAEEKKKYS